MRKPRFQNCSYDRDDRTHDRYRRERASSRPGAIARPAPVPEAHECFAMYFYRSVPPFYTSFYYRRTVRDLGRALYYAIREDLGEGVSVLQIYRSTDTSCYYTGASQNSTDCCNNPGLLQQPVEFWDAADPGVPMFRAAGDLGLGSAKVQTMS